MEELRFDIDLNNILELRCRDSCPCGYMDENNNEIPHPITFSQI
jgi:hypothetical protein